MSEEKLESRMESQARLNPSEMAWSRLTSLCISSFIRSKIKMFASTAIPIESNTRAIPANVRVIEVLKTDGTKKRPLPNPHPPTKTQISIQLNEIQPSKVQWIIRGLGGTNWAIGWSRFPLHRPDNSTWLFWLKSTHPFLRLPQLRTSKGQQPHCTMLSHPSLKTPMDFYLPRCKDLFIQKTMMTTNASNRKEIETLRFLRNRFNYCLEVKMAKLVAKRDWCPSLSY